MQSYPLYGEAKIYGGRRASLTTVKNETTANHAGYRLIRVVHRFVSTSTINAIEHDRCVLRFWFLMPLPPGWTFLLVYGMILFCQEPVQETE
ncbi:MAG: hypothetical protein C7B43_20635 [Sulfobacillus benefaciens]|uniref:Uncharacterized protein n=1 Tax=Sulfobacillus benefaciens TaxID=453960 RepID=A0A2T2WKB1_9FIRM|nr:MAG: hypothetical protein C7B43_20635 [Sulfobacillus benefaciens]